LFEYLLLYSSIGAIGGLPLVHVSCWSQRLMKFFLIFGGCSW